MTSQLSTPQSAKIKRGFVISWILGCIFYLLQYAIRSSPAAMISELSDGFNMSSFEVSSILGSYYYTYAFVSLLAGVAYDRYGAKYPIALGAGILSLGCLLFSGSGAIEGYSGRMLQGAGSAFSFTGCVYLASHGFKGRYIATAIGFTQCMGMLGGSSGQFLIGPMMENGFPVHLLWLIVGAVCGLICLMLLLTTPKEAKVSNDLSTYSKIIIPYKIVFSNPQTYLSGIISGLLFVPTTVFANILIN